MSDLSKLGADRDLEHMLDSIRHKMRSLADKGDDVALWCAWRHLRAALRCLADEVDR